MSSINFVNHGIAFFFTLNKVVLRVLLLLLVVNIVKRMNKHFAASGRIGSSLGLRVMFTGPRLLPSDKKNVFV